MKNYQLLVLIAITLFTFSCSKVDEKPSFDETQLPGTWKISELEYAGTTETTAMGNTATSTFIGTMKESDLEVTFTTDPNEVESTGSYDLDLKTTTMGQTMTSQMTVTEFIQSGSWAIEGDMLKVSKTGSVIQEAKIIELSATLLVLQIDSETSIDLNGISSINEIHAKYRLTKM